MIKLTSDDISLLITDKSQIPLKDILLLGTEVLSLILHNNKECLGCFSISKFCGKTKCSNFDKNINFNEILLNKYEISILKREDDVEEKVIKVPKVEVTEIKKNKKELKIKKIIKNSDKWAKQEKMVKELSREIYWLKRRSRKKEANEMFQKDTAEEEIRKSSNREKNKKTNEPTNKSIDNNENIQNNSPQISNEMISESREVISNNKKNSLTIEEGRMNLEDVNAWHFWGFPKDKK